MADADFTVTEDTIIDEVEYTARPGTRYEIAPDVVATLRRATEGVIEAFDEQSWGGEGDERKPRTAAIEQALRVIDLPTDVHVDRLDVLAPVAGRVRDDFFFMSQGKLSRQMKSFTEAVQDMRSAQAGNGLPSVEKSGIPNPGSQAGPSAGKTATESGPEETARLK